MINNTNAHARGTYHGLKYTIVNDPEIINIVRLMYKAHSSGMRHLYNFKIFFAVFFPIHDTLTQYSSISGIGIYSGYQNDLLSVFKRKSVPVKVGSIYDLSYHYISVLLSKLKVMGNLAMIRVLVCSGIYI